MEIEVAYRRLYLARGCSLVGVDEFEAEYKIGEYNLKLYLGKKPKLNIDSVLSGKPIPVDPNKDTTDLEGGSVQKIELPLKFTPVEDSDFQGEFFFDLLCLRKIECSEEEYKELNKRETENDTKGRLIEEAKSLYQEEYNAICSLVAGYIGLRIHFQFVYELINEQYWVYVESYQGWSVDGFHSPVLHLLEAISLNENGRNLLAKFSFKDEIKPSDLINPAFSLEMLIHGWQEHESVYKFICFFTALEIAVKSYASKWNNAERIKNAKEIRGIIKRSTLDKDRKAELLDFFSRLSPERIPFKLMFRKMIEDAGFEGWEDDVKALEFFYEVRNRIVHGGDRGVDLAAILKNEQKILLEHLAEKYINWVYFGDANIYKTRYRPQPRFIDPGTQKSTP